MNDVPLEIQDLSVRFGDRLVFNHVSLTVKHGEVVVIMGESGVGKTTLLRAIVGLTPYSGRILFLGKELSSHDLNDRRGCMYITQQPNLWEHMTVLDNVALVRRLHRSESRHVARKLAIHSLASLEVDQLAKRYPHRLSGGEQQRVALARGICAEPSLLLVDEVTANIDKDRRQLVTVLLRRMAEAGTAIVCVSHDLSTAHELTNCPIELTADGLFKST